MSAVPFLKRHALSTRCFTFSLLLLLAGVLLTFFSLLGDATEGEMLFDLTELGCYTILAGLTGTFMASLIKIIPTFYSVSFYKDVLENRKGNGLSYLFITVTMYTFFAVLLMVGGKAIFENNDVSEIVLSGFPMFGMFWFTLMWPALLLTPCQAYFDRQQLKDQFDFNTRLRFHIVSSTPGLILSPILGVVFHSYFQFDVLETQRTCFVAIASFYDIVMFIKVTRSWPFATG